MPRLDPTVIRNQVEALIALCPELADDEQLRHDMLEGSTEAFDFLSMVARRIISDKALADGTGAYINELRERKERIDRRVDGFRSLALKILQAANLKKAELPEATFSVTKGREKLTIPDPAAVHETFCKVSYSPDTALIKEALAAGTDINWAAMVTGEPSITMRIK